MTTVRWTVGGRSAAVLAATGIACLMLCFASQARGAEVGIADSEASTFASPLWRGLNVNLLRVIVPYDVATRPAADPRRRALDAWLAALPAGANVNVGLHRINDATSPGYGRAPNEATYRNAFRAFVAAYGARVDRIGPWNEPNFNPPDRSRPRLPGGGYLDQPGGSCDSARPRAATCGPRMAAHYFRWAKAECPACRLIAGEFAGTQSSNYLQKYKRHLGRHRPELWGVHDYADVIRFQVRGDHRAAELRTFVREIFCTAGHHCTRATNWASGQMWIGATGANYSLTCAAHPGLNCPRGTRYKVLGERSQCRAAAFINRLDSLDRRITRIYFYTYMDGSRPQDSDDTGIVSREGTVPRRAYAVVARRARSCPSSAAPAPPAGAPGTPRDVCVGHPSDRSIVCVRNRGRTVDICDRHADGHSAYARVITAASNPRVRSPFYDANDSRSGCSNVPFSSPVLAVAVCVQSEGCSAFRSTSAAPPPAATPATPGAPPAPAPAPPAPAPAPPKDVCASHPSDPSVVCVRNAGRTVDVCDRDADGHRAYARVVTQATSPNFQSPFYDGNDSQAGCSNISFTSTVLSVAVCVQYEGCSALKPT